ncbi:MAG: hydrogenase maturation protease [Terracidiphilus sp.]
MPPSPIHVLILACGNPLREDDGAGPRLAAWAEDRFHSEPRLRILTRQQWTPELAEDIASANAVLFVDCSSISPPGQVALAEVHPSAASHTLATHHLGAAELLALTQDLYGHRPQEAQLLTIGAASLDLREGFSAPVSAALPVACALLEETIQRLLVASPAPQRSGPA